MGGRHKRLIVQADLTSEEDRQFLAWVLERRRKRRLAEEIREGLRLQYQRRMGRSQPAALVDEPVPELEGVIVREREREREPAARDSGTVASKLQRLVGGF